MTKEKALIIYLACHQFRAGGRAVDEESSALARKAMAKASEVLKEHGTIAPAPEFGESYNTFLERLVEGEDLEPRAEGIGEHVAIGVMNPKGLTKLELKTDASMPKGEMALRSGDSVARVVMEDGSEEALEAPDPANELSKKLSQALEEAGADPDYVIVTKHDVDYGEDAPIQQEVVGVVLDSRIIPEDNPLHDLVKAREEDVRRGRIVATSADDLDSDIPPFMRGKKRLPP